MVGTQGALVHGRSESGNGGSAQSRLLLVKLVSNVAHSNTRFGGIIFTFSDLTVFELVERNTTEINCSANYSLKSFLNKSLISRSFDNDFIYSKSASI